jgi:urease subunit alpha
MIHTDTLNESGFVENTVDAIKGRTIHAFHTEGAGGGHAPDIIKVCGLPTSAVLDQPDPALHGQHHRRASRHADGLPSPGQRTIPEDVAFAESRIRKETIAAEDILHDIGAFSIIASDSQAMGRVGEVIIRTWQTADKMKRQRGALPRKPATTTICASAATSPNTRSTRPSPTACVQAHRLDRGRQARRSGAVEPGLLRRQARHGAARRHDCRRAHGRSQRLDPDAAAGALPPHVRRLWQGADGISVTFVSQAAIEDGLAHKLGTAKQICAVENTRGGISKASMVLNDALPHIEVDPETYEVRADGELLTCEPATVCRWRSGISCFRPAAWLRKLTCGRCEPLIPVKP